MQRSRYTDEQIAYALKQAELGTSVKEMCYRPDEGFLPIENCPIWATVTLQ